MLSKQVGLFQQVGVISNNVANVNTVGFKSDNIVYQAFPVKLDSPDHKPKVLDYADDVGTYTDGTEGHYEETNNELDAAIHGAGYFTVMSPLGVRYTRAGDFQINGLGQLVNPQGYQVLDPNGQPIVFQDGDRDIQIYGDGTITAMQDGQIGPNTRGQLGVVTFINPNVLNKLTNGLFSGPAGQKPLDGSYVVAQGVLETSNVNSVTEMTKLIEVNRNSGYLSKALGDMNTLELKALDTINKQ